MKKNAAIALIVAVALLAVALIMTGTTGLNSKLTSGGGAVRIEVGATYDSEAMNGYIEAAGFKSPCVLVSNTTAVEIETGAMSAEALDAAAQKLLASVQADHADAKLIYAEAFTAPEGVHHLRELLVAMLAFAVAGYLYGVVRFGWAKGFAPVLTALVAACVTGSVCAILSGVFAVGSALTAIVAGTACLTYVYAIVACGKMKQNAGYVVGKGDLAVPVLVIVAVVLLTASCGAVQTMLSAVLGAVMAAAGMCCLAPTFWAACSK